MKLKLRGKVWARKEYLGIISICTSAEIKTVSEVCRVRREKGQVWNILDQQYLGSEFTGVLEPVQLIPALDNSLLNCQEILLGYH